MTQPLQFPIRWGNEKTDDLMKAILLIKNTEEASKFFRDLLTEAELIDIADRWFVARALSEGVPYSKIQEQTAMSSTTIARISKWLTQGLGGYRLLIDRIQHHPTSFHVRKG